MCNRRPSSKIKQELLAQQQFEEFEYFPKPASYHQRMMTQNTYDNIVNKMYHKCSENKKKSISDVKKMKTISHWKQAMPAKMSSGYYAASQMNQMKKIPKVSLLVPTYSNIKSIDPRTRRAETTNKERGSKVTRNYSIQNRIKIIINYNETQNSRSYRSTTKKPSTNKSHLTFHPSWKNSSILRNSKDETMVSANRKYQTIL